MTAGCRVDEIAEYLGVSKDNRSHLGDRKGMPGHKVGRFWKFKNLKDVDGWSGRVGSADDAHSDADS